MTPIKHIFMAFVAVITFSTCNNSEKSTETVTEPTTVIVAPAPAVKQEPKTEAVKRDPKVKAKKG